MIAHATHLFGLAKRTKDGATRRAHLEAAAKYDARAREALVAPDYPAECQYLLGWFFELNGRRQSGMNGPLPFSWSDLQAWSQLMGCVPTPWEFRVLTRLDDAFLLTARPEE